MADDRLMRFRRDDDDLNLELNSFGLLSLPEEIIYDILSYLDYNSISESRLVCQTFNKTCQQILNHGFIQVDRLHAHLQKRVKSQLPRRESERRNHPLARHVDILSAIETRLSLLGMTYTRYIDMSLCCFIPGKVLDELFKILAILHKTEQPPRAHEFLQELRDISSMAMEHFEEKISPALKAKMPAVTLPFPFRDTCSSSPDPQPGTSTQILSLTTTTSPMRGHPSIRHEMVRLQVQLKSHMSFITLCRKEISECKNKYIEQSKKASEQNKKITAQAKVIADQTNTITEQEKKLNDLGKKILEYDQKFADVYSELSKMKGENNGNTAAIDKPSSSYGREEFLRHSSGNKTALPNREGLKRPALRRNSAKSKKQKT